MALGATRIDLSRMVMSQAIRLVAFGLGIGLASAIALTTILRTLLFGVGPWDPRTYAGVAALLTTVALAASWMPARKAMGVDPMTALRAQ
jgi:ABC-type antimicrobial peptide transport system permease subunit